MFISVRRDSMVSVILAPIIWSLYFVASYIVSGYACSIEGMSGDVAGLSLVQWLVIALGLLAFLLIVVLTVQAFRGRGRAARAVEPAQGESDTSRQGFLFTVSLGLCGFSLVGTAWLMLAAVAAPIC